LKNDFSSAQSQALILASSARLKPCRFQRIESIRVSCEEAAIGSENDDFLAKNDSFGAKNGQKRGKNRGSVLPNS
jgi:hypothetical protein